MPEERAAAIAAEMRDVASKTGDRTSRLRLERWAEELEQVRSSLPPVRAEEPTARIDELAMWVLDGKKLPDSTVVSVGYWTADPSAMLGERFDAVVRTTLGDLRKQFAAALPPVQEPPKAEYSAIETACRGCMGPCGRCHELQQAIELLKHVRVLDCGAHYCRYCPAKSPAWEHAPHCPYEESQKRNDEARKLRAQLSAALSTPSAGWQAIMRGAAVTCESSPGNRRVVIQCGDDLNKAQRIFAALTAARE